MLLVSSVAPGEGGVGPIILENIFGLYPDRGIDLFLIGRGPSNPSPPAAPGAVRHGLSRHPPADRPWPGRLGAFTAMCGHHLRFAPDVRRLIGEAVAFGREHRIDKVWMVYESPEACVMAAAVADRLAVPLLGMCWDPPDYLLRRTSLAGPTRRSILARLGAGLSRAENVAVISDAMGEELERRWGVRWTVVRHGFGPDDRLSPPPRHDREEVVVGFAGSLHASDAWRAMKSALDGAGWRIDGRPVHIRLFGPKFQVSSRVPIRLEYRGLHRPSDVVRALSACDVCYLPHPFEASLTDFSRQSFPTKLTTYVASGRPTFLHAPDDTAVSDFFDERGPGLRCGSLDPDEVLDSLGRLIGDEATYAEASRAAARVAREDLALETMRTQVARFVGVDEAVLAPVIGAGAGV